jgi:hypothetical protein
MKTNFYVSTLVVVALLAIGSSVRADYVYTFDALNVGALVGPNTAPGQDNWLGSGPTSPTQYVVADGSNKYASSEADCFPARKNDSNWSFGAITSGSLTLSCDARIGHTGQFGLGYTSSTAVNAYVDWANIGGASGLVTSPLVGLNGSSYFVRGAGMGAQYNYTKLATDDTNDWVTVKLVMDYTTGKGVLSAMNLTDGATTFTQIADNIDLQLTRGNAPALSTLNCLYIRTTGAAGNPAVVDNLRIGTTPEPNTAVLLGTGLLGLLAYAWRKWKN